MLDEEAEVVTLEELLPLKARKPAALATIRITTMTTTIETVLLIALFLRINLLH